MAADANFIAGEKESEDLVVAGRPASESLAPATNFMTRDYQCPKCGEWLVVAAHNTQVKCSHCKTLLAVEPDADFVNGLWHDLTQLIPAGRALG